MGSECRVLRGHCIVASCSLGCLSGWRGRSAQEVKAGIQFQSHVLIAVREVRKAPFEFARQFGRILKQIKVV